MPSSLTEFTTLLNLALLVIIMVQIAAAARSIVILERWSRNPSQRPSSPMRKIIRLGVPVLTNLLWAYVCAALLPNVLNTPFETLRFMDYGLLLLLSFALAVFWGMIIKPILGFWALQGSSAPTRQQDTSEPKVPIAAGVA
jgi:hypothetical protein